MENTLSVGNTNIVVTEENGVVRVHIQSDDAVVFMNDEMIYSIGNDVEEFKYVPPKFHKFLLNSGMEYINYSPKEKLTTVDTYPNGESLTFYFPLNKNKRINARLDFITGVEDVRDYLLDVEDEENVADVLTELKTRYQEIIDFVESKGYRFVFSHGMGEWAYGWWDLVFTPNQFKGEDIPEIMDKIKAFNQFIFDIRDKYQC